MSEPRRCGWAEGTFPEYVRYHDEEWGVPARDDHRQFEFLILESAQAGLSWATILKRREGYRRAFASFDPVRVSRFRRPRIERLLENPAIIRNRAKVEAAVNNAKRFLEVQQEFGSFSAYIWGFVGGIPVVNRWRRDDEVPSTSEAAAALTRDMKVRGFRFVGNTILYAHMQATGLVNDHLVSCFRHRQVIREE
ncbi:MAG: DNA-3-methyladenine glycosylase I [Acidobacteria bacterium]|nr:DNA-3-methyladenine glycosylase I [Acidobacteriota bacterium]